MNDTKPFAASTGVWGALAAICGAAAPLLLNGFGLAGSEEQQQLTTLASQTVAVAGGILALVGRITATKRIR